MFRVWIMNLKRLIKDILAFSASVFFSKKVFLDEHYFHLWERKGFHITPIHFYQPIPHSKTLKEDLWHRNSELVGINMNVGKQLELLKGTFPNFKTEYNFPRSKTEVAYKFFLNNGYFGPVDAEVLHCIIRHFLPSRIIEIGSGNSTYLSAQSCELNRKQGIETKLLAVEPFPNENLKKGIPGLTHLIQKRLEELELDFFLELEKNDILFIDSSHVVRIGGDVNYEFLEILPRLKNEVIIHIHDIYLPAEYPRKKVLEEHKFWSEQYLVQAFLSFNTTFEILWASSYMHLNHSDELKKIFPSYTSDRVWPWPSSLWIRRRSM